MKERLKNTIKNDDNNIIVSMNLEELDGRRQRKTESKNISAL